MHALRCTHENPSRARRQRLTIAQLTAVLRDCRASATLSHYASADWAETNRAAETQQHTLLPCIAGMLAYTHARPRRPRRPRPHTTAPPARRLRAVARLLRLPMRLLARMQQQQPLLLACHEPLSHAPPAPVRSSWCAAQLRRRHGTPARAAAPGCNSLLRSSPSPPSSCSSSRARAHLLRLLDLHVDALRDERDLAVPAPGAVDTHETHSVHTHETQGSTRRGSRGSSRSSRSALEARRRRARPWRCWASRPALGARLLLLLGLLAAAAAAACWHFRSRRLLLALLLPAAACRCLPAPALT